MKTKFNQSVENAGVAFIKGANERNEVFFLKKKVINKQRVSNTLILLIFIRHC